MLYKCVQYVWRANALHYLVLHLKKELFLYLDPACSSSKKGLNSLISSFNFIMDNFTMHPEPILGTVSMKQEYTLVGMSVTGHMGSPVLPTVSLCHLCNYFHCKIYYKIFCIQKLANYSY